LGNAEKTHLRRSRNFVVLTYWEYAPRVKNAAALLDDIFDHSVGYWYQKLLGHLRAFLQETFNRPY
jgi:hypothetical protein